MGEIEGPKIQILGKPCGQHGPYTFYKSFKYYFDEKYFKLSLGEFFYVKTSHEFPICIGELQLIWKDKSTASQLASLKLYFLPENTPNGRQNHHGKDEILGLSEKVVLRLEDVMFWVVHDSVDWTDGLLSCFKPSIEGRKGSKGNKMCEELHKDEDDINNAISPVTSSTPTLILSYPQYYRYMAIRKRLEGCRDVQLNKNILQALGLYKLESPDVRVLFCRDTFDCPDLEDHALRCDHLAPKLKGRRRKKKIDVEDKDYVGEESTASESGDGQTSDDNLRIQETTKKIFHKPDEPIYTILPESTATKSKETEFLNSLHNFMNNRNTPIERIPFLGFKQIDLYLFYKLGMEIGGYEQITKKRMWKYLYDQLGGNPSNTGAATCTRRQYERLLLPYEIYIKGQIKIPTAAEKVATPGQSIMSKPKSQIATKTSNNEKAWEVRQQLRKGNHWEKKKIPFELSLTKEQQWDELRRKRAWAKGEVKQAGPVTPTDKENMYINAIPQLCEEPDRKQPKMELGINNTLSSPTYTTAVPVVGPPPRQSSLPLRSSQTPKHSSMYALQNPPKHDEVEVGRPSVIHHTGHISPSQNAHVPQSHEASEPVTINTYEAHQKASPNSHSHNAQVKSEQLTPSPAHVHRTTSHEPCNETPVDFSMKTLHNTPERKQSGNVQLGARCTYQDGANFVDEKMKRSNNQTVPTLPILSPREPRDVDNVLVHPAFSGMILPSYSPQGVPFMMPSTSQLFEMHPGMFQAMQQGFPMMQQQILAGQQQMMVAQGLMGTTFPFGMMNQTGSTFPHFQDNYSHQQ